MLGEQTWASDQYFFKNNITNIINNNNIICSPVTVRIALSAHLLADLGVCYLKIVPTSMGDYLLHDNGKQEVTICLSYASAIPPPTTSKPPIPVNKRLIRPPEQTIGPRVVLVIEKAAANATVARTYRIM